MQFREHWQLSWTIMAQQARLQIRRQLSVWNTREMSRRVRHKLVQLHHSVWNSYQTLTRSWKHIAHAAHVAQSRLHTKLTAAFKQSQQMTPQGPHDLIESRLNSEDFPSAKIIPNWSLIYSIYISSGLHPLLPAPCQHASGDWNDRHHKTPNKLDFGGLQDIHFDIWGCDCAGLGNYFCDPDVTWAPNKTPWRPDLDFIRFLMAFGFPRNQLWSHFDDDVFVVWAIKFKYSFHSRVCFLMIWDQTWHQDAPPGCA